MGGALSQGYKGSAVFATTNHETRRRSDEPGNEMQGGDRHRGRSVHPPGGGCAAALRGGEGEGRAAAGHRLRD